MPVLDSPATPPKRLRETIEGAGFTISDLPSDLTLDQVSGIAQELFRQVTRADSPEVARLLDADDVEGAALQFMRELERIASEPGRGAERLGL